MATSYVGQLLKIGEVAAASGLPVKTIRYYEDIGLLAPAVKRAESGYRLFSTQVLNRLVFIKRAQSLGLRLNEIQEILAIHDAGILPCGAVKQRLLEKVAVITEQIAAMEMLRDEPVGLLSGWQEQPKESHQQKTICPNIEPEL